MLSFGSTWQGRTTSSPSTARTGSDDPINRGLPEKRERVEKFAMILHPFLVPRMMAFTFDHVGGEKPQGEEEDEAEG